MKRLLALVLVFVLSFTLVGCGSGGSEVNTSTTENSGQEQVVLKLGHIVKPDGPVAKAAVKFAEDVFEKTNGAVKIEVYDSGTLGSQRDLLEGLAIGTVDITISSPAIMSGIIPSVSVLDLPYIFKDKEHAYAVLDGEIGQEIFAPFERLGYKCISVWENGFRHITNSKRKIESPADLKGLKIRVPESKLYMVMMEALGAQPTPMEFGELFTALQNGIVDGQENPISQIYSSKFHEVQKFMTLDSHIYATQPVLISNKALEKIPEEYRQILIECCNEARDWQRALVAETESKMLEEMAAAGMEITTLTPEQMQAFTEAMADVWAMFEEDIGRELIDKVANYK